jgi:hypothetical protein
VEQRLASRALQDDGVRRLMTIPGVGLTTAVALVAVNPLWDNGFSEAGREGDGREGDV